MPSLLIDLCIRLHLYRLGAWLCERALARMSSESYETLQHEMRDTPVCAPVFEQLLLGRLRGDTPAVSHSDGPVGGRVVERSEASGRNGSVPKGPENIVHT